MRLVLLHHIPVPQAGYILSAPFIGSQCTFLLGTYQGNFRRINFHRDNTSPPTLQDLGSLAQLPRRIPAKIRFGPSAAVVFRSSNSLEIITYEYCVDRSCFIRKQHDLPEDPSLQARPLAAFDDSTGRIVLETNADGDKLLVLDLI